MKANKYEDSWVNGLKLGEYHRPVYAFFRGLVGDPKQKALTTQNPNHRR